MKFKTLNIDGLKSETLEVSDKLMNLKFNHKLVKYVRNDINSETSIEFIVPNKPLNILKSIVPEKSLK